MYGGRFIRVCSDISFEYPYKITGSHTIVTSLDINSLIML